MPKAKTRGVRIDAHNQNVTFALKNSQVSKKRQLCEMQRNENVFVSDAFPRHWNL